MSDHLSTARQIAEEKGCSMATVNGKARDLGIKVKGRSPDDHQRLLDALMSVKPRKKIAPPLSYQPNAEEPVKKKIRRRRYKKAARTEAPEEDVIAFLKQAKAYKVLIKRRLQEVDKQKAELEALVAKLSALE